MVATGKRFTNCENNWEHISAEPLPPLNSGCVNAPNRDPTFSPATINIKSKDNIDQAKRAKYIAELFRNFWGVPIRVGETIVPRGKPENAFGERRSVKLDKTVLQKLKKEEPSLPNMSSIEQRGTEMVNHNSLSNKQPEKNKPKLIFGKLAGAVKKTMFGMQDQPPQFGKKPNDTWMSAPKFGKKATVKCFGKQLLQQGNGFEKPSVPSYEMPRFGKKSLASAGEMSKINTLCPRNQKQVSAPRFGVAKKKNDFGRSACDFQNKSIVAHSPPPQYQDSVYEKKSAVVVGEKVEDRVWTQIEFNSRNQDGVNFWAEEQAELKLATKPPSSEWDEVIILKLKEIWGYNSFRQSQRDIIISTLESRDVLAIMPTGAGKSLCYQLPALVQEGLTIVFSPLISLIQDQVDDLRSMKIYATSFADCIDIDPRIFYSELLEAARLGMLRLLYLTPEKIQQSGFVRNLIQIAYKDKTLRRFVIDEAHCVSQWGHDFRPAYIQLDCLRNTWPDVPILAVTATATNLVAKDITSALRMNRVVFYQRSFNRENIFFKVSPKKKTYKNDIAHWITNQHNGECGIVYCLSRKECEELHIHFNQQNMKSVIYHAGLDKEVRSENQRSWMNGYVNVCIATCAFGMGINKHNVRYVVHATIPKTVEDYYQQAGRAGRDGKASEAVLWFGLRDKSRLLFILTQTDDAKEKNQDRICYDVQKMNEIVNYASNSIDCRRTLMLKCFGENFNPAECGNTCDTCKAFENNSKVRTVCDVQEAVKVLLAIADCINNQGYTATVTKVRNIFKGSKGKVMLSEKWNSKCKYFGWGSAWQADDVTRLLSEMTAQKLFRYNVHMNPRGGLTSRLYVQDDIRSSEGENNYRVPKIQFTKLVKKAGKKINIRKIPKYLKKKSGAKKNPPDVPSVKPKPELADSRRTELGAELFSLRQELAEERGQNPATVMRDAAIISMAKLQPRTIDEMRKCTGVGIRAKTSIGKKFLRCIHRFLRAKGETDLPELEDTPPPKKLEKKKKLVFGRKRKRAVNKEVLKPKNRNTPIIELQRFAADLTQNSQPIEDSHPKKSPIHSDSEDDLHYSPVKPKKKKFKSAAELGLAL